MISVNYNERTLSLDFVSSRENLFEASFEDNQTRKQNSENFYLLIVTLVQQFLFL